MIGGWPPWRRWLVARRLRRHAQRESGAPPPELLRRLRADIPHRPPVALAPSGDPPGVSRHRRGAARRPWLVAASLAAAATAVVLGLRVHENLTRSPASVREPSGIAGSAAGHAGAAQEAVLPPARDAAPGAAPPRVLGGQASPAGPAAPLPSSLLAPVAPSLTAPAQPSPADRAPTGGAGKAPTGGGGRAAGPGGPGFTTAGAVSRMAMPVRSSISARPAPAAGAAAPVVPRPHAAPPPPIVDRLADGAPGGVPEGSAPPTKSDGPFAPAPQAAPVAGAAAAEPAERERQLLEKPAAADRARRSAEQLPALAKALAESTPQTPVLQPTGAAGGKGAALPGAPPAAEEPAPGALRASSSVAGAASSPAPLRSSFGGSTGIAFYPRLWQELVTEGRLPPPASVRVDQLANAFELSAEAAAVSRPRWTVEGAPLPPAGAAYLLRFAASGLAGRQGAAAVQVEFDPAVVASARRVGASADRNGASALFLVELRPPAAASGSLRARQGASQPAVAGNAGAASFRRGAGGDRVIATLRISPRAAAVVPELPARRVRLSELSPSWAPASPALRVQGLAVQLAEALAAKTPAPRLRLLRDQARSMAAELPAEPKVAALLQLVERAAELAGAPDASPPP